LAALLTEHDPREVTTEAISLLSKIGLGIHRAGLNLDMLLGFDPLVARTAARQPVTRSHNASLGRAPPRDGRPASRKQSARSA
jgi:hypothetical protein